MKRPPLMLLVLDGWGHREARESNAIAASAPRFHELLGRYPHALLHASGREVGLPEGIMGNSEVGHMNLGAGRVIHQDITRIDAAIEDGSFFSNAALTGAMDAARVSGHPLHLVGLVSDGGVHASDAHLRALLRMAKERGLDADRVLIHAITDGRDTPPRSGPTHLQRLLDACAEEGAGRVVSLVGRYWAMDRDQRWERVERAYDLLVSGVGEAFATPLEAVAAAHANDTGDEFVEPAIIGPVEGTRIADDDPVIVFNYRADRVRQLCMALTFDSFDGFERRGRVRPQVTTFTQYRADFPYPLAFPPNDLQDLFPEIVSRAGLRQVRCAETEKYAHVTFFFSGGKEDVLPGEERILLPSPKVATYDLQPEMSAPQVTEALLAQLAKGGTDVYIVNFANADMVGHTGDFDAACRAVAAVDACIDRIVQAAHAQGGTVVITADHGNSEMLWDVNHDQPHTAHTLNPVPILFCGDALVGQDLRPHGVLADVAPTLLQLLDLEQPERMTARSLLR